MTSVVDTLRRSEQARLQQAVCLLLRHGVVTEARCGTEGLALVRRWGRELHAALRDLCGYQVDRRTDAVVLIRVLDEPILDQGPVTRSGRPFDPPLLALLALTLAALESGGSQATLSEVAERVRASAARIPGLGFDLDRGASRRALCHGILWLEGQGVLRRTDGSLSGWEGREDGAEVLYDIDRALARWLFRPARSLHGLTSSRRLLREARPEGGRDAGRSDRRQRLARLLLERPVVYFDDLDEELRAYAWRQGRGIGAELERLTGACLERRAEGLALVLGGAGVLSVERFPRAGSEAQAALLLADRMARAVAAGEAAAVPWVPAARRAEALLETLDAVAPELARGQEELPPVAPLPQATRSLQRLSDRWLDETAGAIVGEWGEGLKTAYRDDPDALRDDALALLARFDLVRPVPGGVVVMPALARYRDVTVALRDAAPHLPFGPPA